MTGWTQDAGWQVGARRTFRLAPEEVWDLLTAPPWLTRWCGLDTLEPGASGVRSLTYGRLVRVRTPHSLIQLRLLPVEAGTTVAFHEDHLPDERTRGLRKDHWKQVLDDLAADLPRSRAVAAASEASDPQT